MKKFNISLEEIYLGSENTKKIIVNILTQAKNIVGVDLSGKTLLIEISSLKENGCIIYFSQVNTQDFKFRFNKHIFGNFSFEYFNIDYLIDSSIRLFETFSHKIFQSSLYIDKDTNKYFLTLITIDSDSDDIISFLKEFSVLKSQTKSFQIFIDEHYNSIIKNNAIEVLYNNFKK